YTSLFRSHQFLSSFLLPFQQVMLEKDMAHTQLLLHDRYFVPCLLFPPRIDLLLITFCSSSNFRRLLSYAYDPSHLLFFIQHFYTRQRSEERRVGKGCWLW